MFPPWFIAAFWLVALVASVLYGWKAVEIHIGVTNISPEKQPGPAWWWHQRWLNFLGSLVGWLALWFTIGKLWPCAIAPCSGPLTLWDAVIASVAFVGVTGYIPMAVVGFVSGAAALSAKAGELLKDLFPKPPKGDA